MRFPLTALTLGGKNPNAEGSVRFRRGGLIAATLLVAVSCKGAEGPKTPLGGGPPAGGAPGTPGVDTRAGLSPAARAALDSGNALFRAHLYPLALDQYRLAAKAAPDQGSPVYGIYMAASALNNKKLADSAMAVFSAMTGNASPMFTDSLMKKAHTDPNAGKAKGPTT